MGLTKYLQEAYLYWGNQILKQLNHLFSYMVIERLKQSNGRESKEFFQVKGSPLRLDNQSRPFWEGDI